MSAANLGYLMLGELIGGGAFWLGLRLGGRRHG